MGRTTTRMMRMRMKMKMGIMTMTMMRKMTTTTKIAKGMAMVKRILEIAILRVRPIYPIS
jgi:hypothetical protein